MLCSYHYTITLHYTIRTTCVKTLYHCSLLLCVVLLWFSCLGSGCGKDQREDKVCELHWYLDQIFLVEVRLLCIFCKENEYSLRKCCTKWNAFPILFYWWFKKLPPEDVFGFSSLGFTQKPHEHHLFICIRSYYLLVFSPLVTLRLAPIVCSKSTCTWWSSPKAHHSVTTYLRNSLVIKRKVVTRKGTGRTAGDEFLCSGLVRFCVQSTARWFLRSPNQQVELWRLSLGLELVLTMYGNIMGAVISW